MPVKVSKKPIAESVDEDDALVVVQDGSGHVRRATVQTFGRRAGGGFAVLEALNVSQNGDYYPGEGVDGFSEVHVSVAGDVTVTTIAGTGAAAQTVPEGVEIGYELSADGLVYSFVTGVVGDRTIVLPFYSDSEPNAADADNGPDVYQFGADNNFVQFAISGDTVALSYIKYSGANLSAYIPATAWEITVLDSRGGA